MLKLLTFRAFKLLIFIIIFHIQIPNPLQLQGEDSQHEFHCKGTLNLIIFFARQQDRLFARVKCDLLNKTTLNMIFNVTYDLGLLDITYVYCIPRISPKNVKLVVRTL